MRPFLMLLVASGAALLTGCDRHSTESGPSPTGATSAVVPLPARGLAPVQEQQLRERGKAIITEASSLLSSNLLAAIQAKGLTNALAYCSVKALPLAEQVATTHQITLRRVSHRARNPQDRADALEKAVLERFQEELKNNPSPSPLLTSNRADAVTLFAPIVLGNPLCLQCHGRPGTDIREDHLDFIRALYPEDEATGFKLGDLRGMWRLDFPRAGLTPAP